MSKRSQYGKQINAYRSRTRSAIAALTLWLVFGTTIPNAAAQTIPVPAVANAVAIAGRITDARNLPIVGAVITARGSSVGWTATAHDGSFRLSLPAGSYEILVRKGGYTPSATSVVLNAGSVKTLSLVLGEANLSSVNIGSARPSTNATLNTGVSATATLASGTISERPGLSVRDVALELPGVTLAHPSDSSPDTSFVVRGGTDETRVQIDGHGVSAGATGRWNSSYASQPLFDSIEVVKGAGVSGANAGESAFGTVNLRTRDFASGRQADVVLGIDGFGGNFSTFALSGNAFQNDRLSYVFEHNLYGYNGPQSGQIVNNVLLEPNGSALLTGKNALTSPLMLGSDLAKLRWRFTGSTSLTVGFIGMHSEYFESGGAFGTFLGERTIVPSAPGSLGGTEYSSPQYPGLFGKTVPAYTFAHNTLVETNQPLFEAELRTAIKNDTLLIRPYVATIYNLVDGSGRSDGPDPSDGTAWTSITTGAGCSTQSPCLVPDSSLAAYRNQEVDRLHGTTFTLIHPLGDATLNVSYDYHSDATTVTGGDPNETFNGTLPSIAAYLPIIPTTLAQNSDWSATYTLPLTRRLRLFAGDYYTDWHLGYGTVVNVPNFITDTVSQTITHGVRDYRHNDPHLGVTWRPQSDTSFRFTAGSAITVPYADLVAGGQAFSGPFTGAGVVSERNPALQPESTVAYDLGFDRRLQNGTVVSVDAFDNTIHNVFATRVAPFDGAAFGIPPSSPYNGLFATTTLPVNAPLERNYGLEVSLAHAPAAGLGYRLATTFQRAFLDQLPASFFFAPSSLVNGKQLDGSTSIPYTHAYGEVNFRHRSGFVASLGADYTGTNNWTNGPAFTVWSSMLRYDFRHGYRAQFSVENLFDHNTGTQYADGIANDGFAAVNYGAQSSGSLPTYGASPTTRFAIAPRTFRFQVEVHVGK